MGNHPNDLNGQDKPHAPGDAALEQVVERLREVTEKVEGLTLAVQSRDVIGQAKGILMERYGISGDQAFEVLASVSSTTNTKLHQVAADLIVTRTLRGLPQQ
jgi:AmiR/NasT family two-component response regulator